MDRQKRGKEFSSGPWRKFLDKAFALDSEKGSFDCD